MRKLAFALVALIAALHFYIAWFEIFAWTSRGPNVFSSFPPELFAQTVDMAANQGIYNAFLAVGLVWSLLIKDARWQSNVAICFVSFVGVAGIMAALTVGLSTGLVQIIPALVTLALLLLTRDNT